MTNHLRLGILAGLIVVSVAGCAARGNQITSVAPPANQMASAKEARPPGPPPSAMSDECMWIGGSTPANWICNGKLYTQFKLHQLREEWKKKQ